MNSILFIKHLSNKLTTHEREDFLKHFGAQRVWFINENSNTAFAQFISIPAAEEALHRLHQLEILGRRLTVEYANNDCQLKVPQADTDPPESSKLKELVDRLNAWNPSLNFLQPPPPHLSYKYPPPTPIILYNIMDALLKNNCFYTQTLHLMNKMCLDPPFGDIKEDIKSYIKESLHYLGLQIPSIIERHDIETEIGNNERVTSEESEISSDENVPTLDNANVQIPIKRKSIVKRINKIPKLSSQAHINNTRKSKIPKFKTEDVFEDMSIQESKKIELKLNSTRLPLPSNNASVEEVGEIGKMTISEPIKKSEDKSNLIPAFVTQRELAENKISLQDMKILPLFKNYHPGAPSAKLYIKNLARDVETIDLERIYKRYIEDCDFSDKELFEIRLMQEGRMKGQAFICFPNIALCEKALNETNGFILKSKPMVVQFARAPK